MITKVYISKSKSKTAIAFFDDLAKQKAETIKKVEDKTRHLRERLLKTNAK